MEVPVGSWLLWSLDLRKVHPKGVQAYAMPTRPPHLQHPNQDQDARRQLSSLMHATLESAIATTTLDLTVAAQ